MSELHVLTTYPEVYSEKRMTDVFPETRLEFSSGSATAPVDFAIEDGKSYIIYFDYVDYEIVAASGAIANDLFSISVSEGVLTVSAADGYHTVGVTACETVYSKLPSSYVEDGGASSWNELKDKPFGTESETIDILAEATLVVHEQLGSVTTFIGDACTVVDGESYVVNWNGVDYKCVAKKRGRSSFGLGNFAINDEDADTGEPFFLIITGEGTEIYANDGTTTLTISIKQVTETIKTLDPKYLPEDIGGGAEQFVVTFAKGEDGTYTADKTFAELEAAVASGAPVRGRSTVSMGTVLMEVYLCLGFYVSGMRAMFSATYATSGTSVQVTTITFAADNSATEATVSLTST